MRLLYVAMTRAEIKLYSVGKGREDKLWILIGGLVAMASWIRKRVTTSYQDWPLLFKMFTRNTLAYDTRFRQMT